MKLKFFSILSLAVLLFVLGISGFQGKTDIERNLHSNVTGVVDGDLQKWHKVTVTFDGPEVSETSNPNPFRDYRLDVTFYHKDKSYTVPGYYAADGNAGESSVDKGNKWRVNFMPDETGNWEYMASFRKGRWIAASDKSEAGKPVAFDGAKGSFVVDQTDKTGNDFRGKGLLRYTGERYLQFAETGENFVKGGADSPENFLAYYEFDGTPKAQHQYQPHHQDWQPGDPIWKKDRGKNIIGALNYLAGKGMNSVYFLTMNVKGDGDDVWPWTDSQTRDRFDCSKLDQWETVFDHMDKLGLMLHVVTQERENDQLLNWGRLGNERKLYYRELIARFGHHPALVWNLGEESTNSDRQRKDFAAYFHEQDPYNHPIVVHTNTGERRDKIYGALLGYKQLNGPSLQVRVMTRTHRVTTKWLNQSAKAGHQWFVSLDEIGPSTTGVKPDADDYWHDKVRKHALWGNLMAGGAGVEWYFGYNYPHNDLNCEDWRSRDHMWDLTRYALEFFQQYLPFTEMSQNDSLASNRNAFVLAKEGEIYAIYLKQGGSTEFELPDGKYTVQWYDPRHGGDLKQGSVTEISGSGLKSIGNPPSESNRDWVALVKLQEKQQKI